MCRRIAGPGERRTLSLPSIVMPPRPPLPYPRPPPSLSPRPPPNRPPRSPNGIPEEAGASKKCVSSGPSHVSIQTLTRQLAVERLQQHLHASRRLARTVAQVEQFRNGGCGHGAARSGREATRGSQRLATRRAAPAAAKVERQCSSDERGEHDGRRRRAEVSLSSRPALARRGGTPGPSQKHARSHSRAVMCFACFYAYCSTHETGIPQHPL